MSFELVMNALFTGFILSLVSFSISLSFESDDVPNPATGALMGSGAYILRFAVREFGRTPYTLPYYWAPICFLVGGLVNAGVFSFLVHPLKRRGDGLVRVLLCLFAVEVALSGVNNVLEAWYYEGPAVYVLAFQYGHHDFMFLGVQGVFFVAGILMLVLPMGHWLISMRSDIGVVIRGVNENIELSEVQGLDTRGYRLWIWFISGGLVCVAGMLYPVRLQGKLDMYYYLWMEGLAGCFLGGCRRPRYAMIGGFLMGPLRLGVYVLGRMFIGVWVGEFLPLIPITVIALVMYYSPEGVLNQIIPRISRKA